MTQNAIAYVALEENRRHNLATENLGRDNFNETKRHNVVGEKETNRHNLATEHIDLGKLEETVRHNQVTESETQRHNVQTENETRRHNIRNESIDLGNLEETIRSHKANESINIGNLQMRGEELKETIRSHRANERNTATSNAIQKEYTQAMANAQRYKNILDTYESDRRDAQAKRDQQRLRLEGVKLTNELNNSKFKNTATGVSMLKQFVTDAAKFLGGKRK